MEFIMVVIDYRPSIFDHDISPQSILALKRKQPLFAAEPWKRGRPIAVLRKNQVIELKIAYNESHGAGRYRIGSFGEKQLKLMPPHLANEADALTAAGFTTQGLQAYWHILLPCLGYELPHPTSPQPESSGAAET